MSTTMLSPSETTSRLLHILTSRGQSDYIGEPISQLEHSLQCASLASLNGADNETVIAALLHDIGQFLPAEEVRQIAGSVKDMRASKQSSTGKSQSITGDDSGSVGRVGHETIGGQYLLSLDFSPKVAALVESHVAAKRYLCATESGYSEALSDASKTSLEFQGGSMSEDEVGQWKRGEWSEEMARLRKWDDGAKIIGAVVPGVDAYESMIRKHLEERAATV